MVPTGPVTGVLKRAKGKVKVVSVFNIDILYVHPLGLPVNVVGDHCATASPITLAIKGPINLGGSSTFTGIYTIPFSTHCELNTLLVNSLTPGPNNTFTANFSPAS